MGTGSSMRSNHTLKPTNDKVIETNGTGNAKPDNTEDVSSDLSAQNAKSSQNKENEDNLTPEEVTNVTDVREGSAASNKTGKANNKNKRLTEPDETSKDTENSKNAVDKGPTDNSSKSVPSSDYSLLGRDTSGTLETENKDSRHPTINTEGESSGQKTAVAISNLNVRNKNGSKHNGRRYIDGVAETVLDNNAKNNKITEQTDHSNIKPRVEITEDKEQNGKEVGKHARNAHRSGQKNDQKAGDEHKPIVNELKSKVKEFLERYGNHEVFPNVLWGGLDKFSAASGQTVSSTDPRKDYSALEKTLIDLKREKAKHLNRLSEIASSRLQHNNPDIADLSDENRATKLAEKLSELYDNEWTDVYEAVKKKANADTTDKTIALSLKEILKVCYDTCREKSQTQRSFVLRALYMNRGQDETNVPAGLGLCLTVLQKSSADVSLKQLESIFTSEIQGWLQGNFVLKKLSPTKRPLSSYINLCTTLSWHIQTQNPPLVLDFEGKENPTVLFRPYTVTGQHLSYVLWPALFLHENGPVVSKGVAQFSKEPENETGLQSDNKEGQNVPQTCSSNWQE